MTDADASWFGEAHAFLTEHLPAGPHGALLRSVLERPLAILRGPPPEQGVFGWPDLMVHTAMSVVALPHDLLDVGVACLSNAILPPGLGFPAARLLLNGHVGMPHMHLPPPAPPLPGVGVTAAVGALNVLYGGIPMLRTGDVGVAPTCGGSPIFKIYTGSASVFVGGKRAARTFDVTEHCPMIRSSPGRAASSMSAAFAGQIGHSLGPLQLASLATGVVAHGAAAVSDADTALDAVNDGAAGDGVLLAAAEVHRVVVGTIQGAADGALGAMHAMIGIPPPLMGTGIGVLAPIVPGPPGTLRIGGLPAPDASDIVSAVRRGARSARACGRRVRRRLREGYSWRCALFADPVDAVGGHVLSDHVDVDLGGGLRFTRRYDTRARERIGDCGRGMRHAFERELDVWLHRVAYVDASGVRYELPAFRGQERVARDGVAATRRPDERYEIAHRGETMVFVATPGVRAARLVEIRSADLAITIEHDGAGRFRGARGEHRALFVRRDPQGLIECLSDDRGVEHARFAYERGRLVAARDAEGAEERFVYDDAHRVTTRCDARGHRFTWRYDDEGRCVHTSGEDGLWSCDFVYAKEKTTVTHGTGLVETVHFDAYGTVLRVARSDGGFVLRELDAEGRIARERDAAGRVTEWLYDDTGENVGRRDRFGHWLPPDDATPRDAPSPLARALPQSFADRLGLAVTRRSTSPVVLPGPLAPLAAWALSEPLDRETRDERDALGRVIRAVDGRGLGTALRRDGCGNVIEQVDRDGRITRTLYGRFELPVAVVDPIGRRIDVTHTSTEELRTYRDPRGSLTEYGRDAADRLVSITENGRLVESYAYDAGDRLIEKRDGEGAVLLRVAHGANALPKKITLSVGGTIELDYDARGRVTRARLGDHDARLERDADRTVLFDQLEGRGVRRWRFGARETTSLFERFETRVERDGGRVLVRDPTGRLSTFDGSQGRVVRSLGNGTREILAIDPEGRLEGRLAHRTTSDGALATWAVRYERSGEGDVLSVWDTARGERRFEIDAAHRLESEIDERGARHDFTHDACDDVIAGGAEVRIDGVLVRTKDEVFEHDARGRMCVRTDASGHTTRYHYDALDQLVAVELADGARWTGSYDGLGRLRRFGLAGRDTLLYWDGDRIAAELAHDGALRVHVYADARALIPFAFVDYASIDAEPESGRAFYVFHDASGMPTQIEDASGHTVWCADRVDPYGAITLHPSAEIDYALRWPGHYLDRDLGLHHNRFRAYDPHLARYLQPDPIGHAGSPHSLYAYAPNPLVDVDVLGLECPTRRRLPAQGEPIEGHPVQRGARRLANGDLSASEWIARCSQQVARRWRAGIINGRWAVFPSARRGGWDPETGILHFDPEGSERDRAALRDPRAAAGVRYREDGTPDLDRFAATDHDGRAAIVTIENFSASRSRNMEAANLRMQQRDSRWQQPEGTTWHEEPGGRMVLVPSRVHDAVPHTGGVARQQAIDGYGRVEGAPIRNASDVPSILPRDVLAMLAGFDDDDEESP